MNGKGEPALISFYTALTLLSWMALAVLCILVYENSWIPKEDKHRFYLTYGLIALSALAEWIGIQLSGNEQFPTWLLALVKCADYILTPLAGGAVVAQMNMRNRWNKALMLVLAVNTVLQLVACFNSWMVVIDEHNRYSHGPLYIVYILIYLFVIALTAVEFLVFGLAYRKQNRASLFAVFLLVIAGIGMQEIFGGECRTAYAALTMGVALMFIHYAEFYKMTADEHIQLQHNQLMKDALSGVFSRHAYMKALEKYKASESMPDDLAVLAIDINGLKTVNDTVGHEAGDELIIGAARCIEHTVGNKGKCYRIGGDEFVVLAQMEKDEAAETLLRLKQESDKWSESKRIGLSLSAGYALAKEHQGLTVEELVKKADREMYVAKAAYYKLNEYDLSILR